jgi:hypothetical protein
MRVRFLISVGCLVGCVVQTVPGSSTGGAAVINQCSTAAGDFATVFATDCPRDVCGLNGIWMGAGVPFRTMHLDGGPNEAQLRIRRSVDSTGKPIDLHLQGDALTATARGETTAKDIRGASLFLGPSDHDAYKLTITDVTSEPFWAECDKPACSKLKLRQSKQYHFTATRLADGCAVQVCDPSLSDNPDTGIAGVAAIFRDDYYDDRTYSVSSTPPVDTSQKNDDLFNIACRGTDIYKLYMLRHAQASATATALGTTLPQRTTLLRALSASYCAHDRNGNPGSHFTHDGVPIEIRFNPVRSFYAVTQASGYQYDGGEMDALWSTNADLPALCIKKPRTTEVEIVEAECDLPICEDGRDDDYLMTATPNPVD